MPVVLKSTVKKKRSFYIFIIVFSYFNRPNNEFEARFEIDDDEIDDSLAVSKLST